MALAALRGVGDAGLGQWHEWTGKAYHVRRRLSPTEQLAVGDVCDLRGTEEGSARLSQIQHLLHPVAIRFAAEELIV